MKGKSSDEKADDKRMIRATVLCTRQTEATPGLCGRVTDTS